MIQKLLGIYNRLSKRERWIFYGTALVVGILFSDRFLIGPVHTKLADMDRRIRDEETFARESLLILLKKKEVVAESEQLKKFIVKAGDPEQEMTALLKKIEGLAQEATVSLVYVKPAASREETSGVKKYLATLECEGQMDRVMSFFYSIESSVELLQIERYAIQSKTKESSIARCEVTVSKTVLV